MNERDLINIAGDTLRDIKGRDWGSQLSILVNTLAQVRQETFNMVHRNNTAWWYEQNQNLQWVLTWSAEDENRQRQEQGPRDTEGSNGLDPLLSSSAGS